MWIQTQVAGQWVDCQKKEATRFDENGQVIMRNSRNSVILRYFGLSFEYSYHVDFLLEIHDERI